jgi:error-prone DNA polymerase
LDPQPHQRLTALLNCQSYFSFGSGTASPTRLVRRAKERGYRYLAITDYLNVTAGVELFSAAQEEGVRALIGATVPVSIERDTYELVLLARSRAGYANLNRIVTHAHERENRNVPLPVLLSDTTDLAILTGGRNGLISKMMISRRLRVLENVLEQLKGGFNEWLFVQIYHDNYQWDSRRSRIIRRFAISRELPVACTPQIKYADPSNYRLYDALMCSRLGITVDQPNHDRPQNDQSAIDTADAYFARLPFPEAIENTNRLAEACYFDLLPDRLAPPKAHVPTGITPQQHLEQRCFEALLYRYAGEKLEPARTKLLEELLTIQVLDLAEFFLVAAEVTDYCRQRSILAAGRGSAASSICCYLLGITQVDPVRYDLLFERFLHTGKSTMPDIDIDISSSRRDEVLTWVEERFGQTTEAMVCNKITYRLPLAIQDLGRSLGIPPKLRNALTASLGRDFRGLRPPQVDAAENVFEEVLSSSPANAVLTELLRSMEPKHPRHLAPHSGGVVLSKEPLFYYSPLERSSGGIKIIQLDKDDAEALGLIKLDLLGLRMLSALEHAREEVFRMEGAWLDLGDLPDESPVWDLISSGDTLGLFQVESPSQQHISKTMRSRTLRDLAHQIALIRPGPIQSGSVHPYLRRRHSIEKVTYLHPSLEPILKKTYGVLLFQEDVIRICVHFVGMDWVEADRFRKKVSGWTGLENIESDRKRFLEGARRTVGATEEDALAVFNAVKSFQGYGFAESHAWAFALHTYASSWLRVNYPHEFLAAIMTEEPGMWAQSTKRQEARDWGVRFAKLSINKSGVHYRCELVDGIKHICPPLSAIKGISAESARSIVIERLLGGHFESVESFYSRVVLTIDEFQALAKAGVFDHLCPRREALYTLVSLSNAMQAGANSFLTGLPPSPPLKELSNAQEFVWDYQSYGFSTKDMHPLDLIRDQLRELACTPLLNVKHQVRKSSVRTAGLVVGRQKPGTAKGFAFFVIEDGPVRCQLIINPQIWESNRVLLRDASVLVVDGSIVDTASHLAIKLDRVFALSSPMPSRGYHYGR